MGALPEWVGASPHALCVAGGVPSGWRARIREEKGVLGVCGRAAGRDTAVLSRRPVDMRPACRANDATWRAPGVTAPVKVAERRRRLGRWAALAGQVRRDL